MHEPSKVSVAVDELVATRDDSPPPTSCPVDHASLQRLSGTAPRTRPQGELDPMNHIPELAQAPSPGQKMALPLERTMSSIPKPNAGAGAGSAAGPSACPVAHATEGSAPAATKPDQWEYPSPQQFYNALVRKGWETPEESVEMMVDIHNWINEEAWAQVRRWEEKHDGGSRSMLARFQGRPQDLSPKARYHLMMGKLFPNYYGSVKPFDRHDWLVHRPIPRDASSGFTAPSSTQNYTEHRYVIDYYSLPEDAQGNPVFSLDVRPAVDSVEAVQDRLAEWWKVKKEAWMSGSGASVSTPDSSPGVRVQES
ncbi:BZ3500_MvSof-1268-A1-R1_Chr6-3g08860 [Microbotryum saponariae]|uniref:Holocytochrome c-type synthase n=1 Tax=Microbotryum saponariae TaxID=289078 RepID=A0A2X0KP11_9BASI|nr:BZ3500_MvSof-1268-A1-R1_Chr6-3g08860 [Microbotryum saponariae]SDA07461.1 BZ3501_MvSof-1269-A2-R1_Chr6-2g08563 [Microbotryum saponariae]